MNDVQEALSQAQTTPKKDDSRATTSLIAARADTESPFVQIHPLKRYRPDSSCHACGKEGQWWKERPDCKAKMRGKLQRRLSSIKQRLDDT